jgi:1-deoxy-D-xylulose-5-phosphate reductoisomerase
MANTSECGDQIRRVALFGSTGSIGQNTLDVARRAADRIQIVAISAHSRLNLAAAQAREFHPRWFIATDAEEAGQRDVDLPHDVELLVGPEALEKVARSDMVDTVVSAIVGIAGLRGTWAAVDAGKRVALANKETMVAAGSLINEVTRRQGAQIIPVDSEHSAVFQALAAGRRQDVRRIILTASGGPFRQYSREQLRRVTVGQALEHPTWKMGQKITIDSATMMNKALEIIEARFLFDLEPEQISVVVHPQSVVHSMVEFIDGSIIAQLSQPDMRLPIQYAISYPERWPAMWSTWQLDQAVSLEFEPPDFDRFPALQLGLTVARDGGTAGVVLNAANEAAVQQFITGSMPFHEIVPACQAVLQNHHFEPRPSLNTIFALDAWAREEMHRWICA